MKNQPQTHQSQAQNQPQTTKPTTEDDIDLNSAGNQDLYEETQPVESNGEMPQQNDEAAESGPQEPQEPQENNPLTEANAQIAELTNDLQRTRADFENYRKQIEMQKSQAAMIAKFAVVDKFLPLIDNFERAIQSYPEQLAPLAKSFEKSLKEVGLQRIDSEPGTEFNPDLHEAVMMEEGDGDTDVEVISETLRPGYTYDGSVVRTAMVKVKH